MWVDSHCHLSFPELSADLPGVLARMRAAGVDAALNVCVMLEEFDRVLAATQAHAMLYASVGVHPDNREGREPDVATLVGLAQHEKVVAIGETGLDYYRLGEPLDWQRERFRTHIRAARESGKPLIVHTRAAPEDTLAILREERAGQAGGVMHCFTESRDFARAALDLGFYISFSGIVTFNNAHALREVAAEVPDDRLLIETDAPYLAPVPFRGRVNEPAYVAKVAERLAAVRGQAVEHIAVVTTDNFYRLFNSIKRVVDVNSRI
jgi:TatD DNase family protein